MYTGKVQWTLEPFLLRELAPETCPTTGKTSELGKRRHSWDTVTMCKFGSLSTSQALDPEWSNSAPETDNSRAPSHKEAAGD